jgi:hypothetical protein
MHTLLPYPQSAQSARCSSLWAILTLCLSATIGFGQTTELVPGTVVTGQCQFLKGSPGCVLPNLFGDKGLTLYASPVFPHYAHFTGSAQETLNQTISTAIATQLAILPLISPASGFTYKFDSSTGVFVPTTSSFGPIYTERADTIGRHKFSIGTSYQRFRFQTLDGIDLKNIPAVFSHVPIEGGFTFESDVIATNNSLDLHMDQTMVYATFGLTDRIDLSVAVPFVSVRTSASSYAQIYRVSGEMVPINGRIVPNPHSFTADHNSLTNIYSASGNGEGIGDVTVRGKVNFLQREKWRAAVIVDVRTPTGDPWQWLGSGAVGVKPFVAISGGKRFSPHVNVGYQWNGSSILAGNLTGATITEDEAAGKTYITNGPAQKADLPDVFFYSAGFDAGATKRITVAVDYLGQTVINAPRVFSSTFYTANIPGGTGTLALPTVTGGMDNIGLNSMAVGAKVRLFGNLLLTGDVLFRLDNRGLRQDVTPLVALSYTGGH